MTLYTEEFDTDWETLTREEAMMRAFALGSAAALGHHNETEYQRIKREMATNYDASIVELAYEEGKGKTARRKQDIDARGLTLWRQLLTEEFDADLLDLDQEIDIEDIPVDLEDADRATDFPSAVGDRTAAIDRPDRDPEQTDMPDFLE